MTTTGTPGSKPPSESGRSSSLWDEFGFDTLCVGTLGGCAVALYFLVVDLLEGRPLHTPAIMGDMVLRGVALEAGAEDVFYAVAYFSLAHITAFITFGALITWLVHEVELHAKHPLLGILVIVLIMNVGFFLLVPLVLPGVVRSLGIARILSANLLAAAAMGLYFVFRHRSGAWHRFRLAAPDFIFDSVYAGALGGTAVGLFFLVVDAFNGDPLFTPSLMGSVLFLGVPAQEVVKVQLDLVAYVTALHMVGFVLLGAAITWVVHEVELHSQHPAIVLIVLFAIIEATFVAVASVALPGVIERVGVLSVGGANLLAAAAIVGWFVWSHQPGRRVAEEITDQPESTA